MAESCCPPGSWPALKSEESGFRGSTEKLSGGTEAYVVGPVDGKATEKGLVLLQDIFAYNSGRCRGVADQFANEGYLVVMPDFTGGKAVDGDIVGFLKEFPNEKISQVLKEEVVPMMKQKGVKSAGVCGFCWGCLNVFYTCVDEVSTSFFKAGVSFHPSLALHGLVWGGDAEALDLAEQIKVPQLLLSAQNDPPFVREDGSIITCLKSKGGAIEDKSKVVNFDDMAHGWVNRGDTNFPVVEAAVKKALELAIEFLKDVLV